MSEAPSGVPGPLDLTGRVAVVTGAGRGIGAAIATALAGAGARVAVADLDLQSAEGTAAAICAAGGRAEPVPVDVTRTEAVAAMVAQVRARLGPIGILVNNAGWDRLQPFLESEEATWRRVVEINYLGVVRCCKAVLPEMVARRAGRIVNIGSDAGRVGSSGEAVYSGAKGAVIAFTKALARETARHRVNVNCVCPGPSLTPLFQEMQDYSPGLTQSLEKAIPWGRLGQPTDVAGAVVFLASDLAGFITGQTLSVSGGLTMC